MSDRDQILAVLPDSPVSTFASTFPSRAESADIEKLWEGFSRKLSLLGGRVTGLEEAISLIEGKTCFIDEDARSFLSPGKLDDVWSAEIGITTAKYAIAETASLVLSAGPGKHRLASLAPPVHLAIVRHDAILPDLETAIARLDSRTSVFITGSSRTADIEGVLVRGVHGPRELIVVKVP